MSLSLILYRLQQIDSQIDKYHSRQNFIAECLNDDSLLRQAIENAGAIENNFLASAKHQDQLENTINDLRIKIEQSESSLYSGTVKSPRELQDIQSELVSLRRYLQSLEDKLIEAMIAVEDNHLQNKKTQAQLIIEKANRENLTWNLKLEQSKLLQELQKLDLERTVTLNSISPEQISHYEQLRLKRKGLAVTTIQDNACAACGTTLTLSIIQTAHAPGDLTLCPSCGRILYGN